MRESAGLAGSIKGGAEEVLYHEKCVPDPSALVEVGADSEVHLSAQELSDKYGESERWGEHPLHSRVDWRMEVENGDTLQGYWEWAVSRIQMAAEDSATA